MSREEHLRASATVVALPDDPATDDIRLQVDLRLHLDEIAEAEATRLRLTASPPTRQELCRLACRIYDARRARDKVFDREIFGEPAWDMLLALYCLPTRGEIMTVTALSLAAGAPLTTGLRWQKTLTSEGLIERGPKGVDLRRQSIRLTADGRALMEQYLTRLLYCQTSYPPSPEAAGG